VWSDPDLANRLGQAARARAEREFSLDQQVRSHLELFERLIQSRKKLEQSAE
jgi:glycosyltransferase involved in cell wall biosynthesis